MFIPFSAAAAPKARPLSFLPPRRRQCALYIPAPETFVLAALCLMDLGSTIWWVSYREAAEGNPIMAYYLTHGGTLAFMLAKLVLIIMPLVIMEWARQSRPKFVHAALRVGIAGYIGLYAVGVAHINHAEAGDDASGGGPTEYAAPVVAHRAPRPASPSLSGKNPSACEPTDFPDRLMQNEE